MLLQFFFFFFRTYRLNYDLVMPAQCDRSAGSKLNRNWKLRKWDHTSLGNTRAQMNCKNKVGSIEKCLHLID